MIREIMDAEMQEAKKIYCESFHKEYKETTVPLTGTILGIYLEQQLIGIVQIDFINDIFENKKIGLINSLCIKNEYRHQGYGDTLLKKSIQLIQENGGNEIRITSNKNRIYAHKLYQKNQFEPVDTIFLKKDL